MNKEDGGTSMFDKLKNIFNRRIENFRQQRESRILSNQTQNKLTGMASESGCNLTSEKNIDAREEIARASQDSLLLKARSYQPNS